MTELPNNLWKSPVIKKRLLMEACFEGNRGISDRKFYWCSVPEADSKDGFVVIKNFEVNIQNQEPHPLQQDFAIALQKQLMKELHFNGLWLCGWTHPPTAYDLLTDASNCWGRMIFIWHDADGDPQYTLESEMDFAIMVQNGFEYYLKLAHEAHEGWREIYSDKILKADMLLTEDQQKKAALEALKDV